MFGRKLLQVQYSLNINRQTTFGKPTRVHSSFKGFTMGSNIKRTCFQEGVAESQNAKKIHDVYTSTSIY